MIKIVKYEIARATLIKNLEWHVQHMILNGWQPYGTITLFPYGDVYMLMQPMVMYECQHEWVTQPLFEGSSQSSDTPICRKCKCIPDTIDKNRDSE